MLRILDNIDSSKIGMNYSSSGFSPTIRNHIYDGGFECQFAICAVSRAQPFSSLL
jgi:hypothetical protein